MVGFFFGWLFNGSGMGRVCMIEFFFPRSVDWGCIMDILHDAFIARFRFLVGVVRS